MSFNGKQYINNIKKKYVSKKINKQCKAININNYYKNENQLNAQLDYYDDLRNCDTIYKILNSLTHRATGALKKYNVERKITHIELIGCSLEVLRAHLTDKFVDGMTFNNYGEWEIDHIKPISKFNLSNDKELFECFNYKNLQPLWMTDNRKKSSKIL